MKKLLLIAAILAIGTSVYSFELDDGSSINAGGDMYYNPGIVANGGHDIATFPVDITTNDNAIHTPGAANVFRHRGPGGDTDVAFTGIDLRLIKPVKIESEIDALYAEAFEGDNVQFGDIGFTVSGGAPVDVRFDFAGNLFAVGGGATVKVTTNPALVDIAVKPLGQPIVMTIPFAGAWDEEKLEMDLYLKTADDPAGMYIGMIMATATFQ